MMSNLCTTVTSPANIKEGMPSDRNGAVANSLTSLLSTASGDEKDAATLQNYGRPLIPTTDVTSFAPREILGLQTYQPDISPGCLAGQKQQQEGVKGTSAKDLRAKKAEKSPVKRSSKIASTKFHRRPLSKKPKRPLSAYNFFFRHERERILAPTGVSTAVRTKFGKRLHRKSHGVIGFQDLARIVAARWKAADQETRRPFEEKAAVEKRRYQSELEVYNKRLRGAEEESENDEESTASVACHAAVSEADSGVASPHFAVSSSPELKEPEGIPSLPILAPSCSGNGGLPPSMNLLSALNAANNMAITFGPLPMLLPVTGAGGVGNFIQHGAPDLHSVLNNAVCTVKGVPNIGEVQQLRRPSLGGVISGKINQHIPTDIGAVTPVKMETPLLPSALRDDGSTVLSNSSSSFGEGAKVKGKEISCDLPAPPSDDEVDIGDEDGIGHLLLDIDMEPLPFHHAMGALDSLQFAHGRNI